MPELITPRFRLTPLTLPVVEAVLARDRARAEALVGAVLPGDWPNDDLVARAFPFSLAAIRAAPDIRLWGDSLVLAPDAHDGAPARVLGSVVFHGRPDDGIAEVGYGIEEGSRGRGLATLATSLCVEWALAQAGIVAVRATTFPWHVASLAVIRKLGMAPVGHRDHDTLGDLLVFERRR